MNAIDFESVFDTLKNNIVSLAKDLFHDYVNQATADGQNLLQQLKQQLLEWTQELATGALSTDDFTFLVQGEKEEVEMVTLKQAGLAEVEIDKFKNSVIDMVISTIGSLIKV